eukprot:scaffold650720_cov46-Prasinocladus_malaysianus.AAC.1
MAKFALAALIQSATNPMVSSAREAPWKAMIFPEVASIPPAANAVMAVWLLEVLTTWRQCQ